MNLIRCAHEQDNAAAVLLVSLTGLCDLELPNLKRRANRELVVDFQSPVILDTSSSLKILIYRKGEDAFIKYY